MDPIMQLDEHLIVIGDLRISYCCAGPIDKTVVFIHGNSSCKAAFRYQYPDLLSAGYGVLALDLPGHGESSDSPDPDNDYTIPAYADLVRLLCEENGVMGPALLGWSLGGHVALQLAGNSLDIAGLALCGTPPISPGTDDAKHAFLKSEFSDVTGDAYPSWEKLESYITAVYGTMDHIPAQLRLAGFRADGLSRSTMIKHWRTGTDLLDQRAIAQNWQKPIMMIHGTKDAFVSADFIRSVRLTDLHLKHPIKFIEDVGHAPFLENPVSFNELLLGFCDTVF